MAASDPPGPWWRDGRMVAAFVWIFGCAAYYYVRFTWVFLGEYGEPMRALWERVAG